jgi:hypothetical protein
MSLRALAVVAVLALPVPVPAVQPPSKEARPEAALGDVRETRPVRLEKPALFYRDGKPVMAQDGMLIRVGVVNPGRFLPTALTPPFFFYGRALCRPLQSPWLGGEAVVLCPRPAPGEPAVLWLTPPGASADRLTRAQTDDLLKRASSRRPGGAVRVRVPGPGEKPTTYRDASELEREVLAKRRGPSS